ncbi:MAG: acetyl-CoA carboxylase biotin carboxyl carrier protein [Clostridia bacterium]|jgi:acetyl-CoA carboxylase biotin carboxyl carrier protein|nr:acetyl-CoA carboxylase biotin carboxyl carrier protein [Clostridia bacterium]
MEYDKIKQLMEDMSNSKLSAIDIDFPDGTKISMKKDGIQETKSIVIEPEIESNCKIENKIEQQEVVERKGNIVKSPMVGTFYLKPSPTSEPYVEVGKTVKKGDTLCIIEAMKLMNEIESEFSGTIKEILVKDEEPVEYGKPLFIIE